MNTDENVIKTMKKDEKIETLEKNQEMLIKQIEIFTEENREN